MTNPAAGVQTALILLFRSTSPFVLYPDDPNQAYEEFKAIIRNRNASSPKLIEKSGSGPIKKLVFVDTELIGVSLQQGMTPTGVQS